MRQVIIKIEAEKENMVDTLWYEQRYDSKRDEKNNEANFCKELVIFFRKIEPIGQNLSHERDNEDTPQHTYQSWHNTLKEPLVQVAE